MGYTFTAGDWLVLAVIVIGLVIFGFYMLNKKLYAKYDEQEQLISKTKQMASIYIIDKKKDRITNINMPKAAMDQVPFIYKYIKMYFVQAKIGPQIMTLMCDKKVYNAIPLKKNIKVELAGIYIVSVAGMKSEEELKTLKKEKKAKAKEAAKNKKDTKAAENKPSASEQKVTPKENKGALANISKKQFDTKPKKKKNKKKH